MPEFTYEDIVRGKHKLNQNGYAPDRIVLDEDAADSLMDDDSMESVTNAVTDEETPILKIIGIDVEICERVLKGSDTPTALLEDTSATADPRAQVIVSARNSDAGGD